jgi:light-regulated signal transduction histidine kinase (bacteriophytochrome)
MQQPDMHALLALCKSIPVTSPGTIQSHGALLAVDRSSKRIVAVSENLGEFFGYPPEFWLNRTWSETLHEWFVGLDLERVQHERRILQFSAVGLSDVELRVSANEEQFLLEVAHVENNPIRTPTQLWQSSVNLLGSKAQDELHQEIMRSLHNLIGYSHIMVYRFDANWNGRVIAELLTQEAEGQLCSYLGLCFPETDVPAQARELYLSQWVRNKADVESKPCRILGINDTPLNLGSAFLRSISGSHRQYLINMQVRASFSFSIIIEGKLWGLVAAHHTKPGRIALSTLVLAEDLARMYSGILTLLLQREQQAWIESNSTILNWPAMLASQGGDAFEEIDEEFCEHICTAFACHGLVFWEDGNHHSYGLVPSTAGLEDIFRFLGGATLDDGIFATSNLRTLLPGLSSESSCGFLALGVPSSAGRWFLLCRNEEMQEIEWGGDPRVESMRVEGGLLSPRNSFKAWRELVAGVSRPWTEEEISIAKILMRNLTIAHSTLATMDSVQKTAKITLLKMLLHDVGNGISGVSGQVIRLQQLLGGNTIVDKLRRLDSYVEENLAAFDRAFGEGKGESLHQLLEQMISFQDISHAQMTEIVKAVDTGITHVRELLDLQRTYARSASEYDREYHVSELLIDAVGVLQANIDSRGKVRLEIDKDLPFITIDRSRLMQVVINILKNSYEAWDARCDDKPPLAILIKGHVQDDNLRLVFSDNGIGFDAETASVLLTHRYSTKERSSGLGLLSCKKIIEGVGASLNLSSAGINLGAQVILSIPRELWA